jgi:hypothetical protein
VVNGPHFHMAAIQSNMNFDHERHARLARELAARCRRADGRSRVAERE